MHEQFPPEVVARRRRLIPILWDAKKIGKTALISYDTLYIDGTPVYMDWGDEENGVKLMVWNCNGLSTNNTENVDFVNRLLQNDVNILLESWTDDT